MTTWVDGTTTSRAASLLERKARRPGAVYAADYGVVADNTTDDATNLNAAITAAAAGVVGGGGNAVYLPAGGIKVGSQIQLKNKTRLVGMGKRATVITAISGTFPTGTPIIRKGVVGAPFEFDMRLEDLTVDAAGIATSTCVYSNNANEGSGCFGVSLQGFTKYGVHYDDGCSVIGSKDLEFTGSGVTPLAGFYAYKVAGQNYVQGVTTLPGTGAAVLIQQSQYRVSDIHCEQSDIGVRVNDSVNCQIENVCGHSLCPILVQLDSNTGKCSVQNVFANGSATSLKDDYRGVTLVDDFVFYAQDDVRIGANRMGTGTAAPTTGAHARGEIVWNSTPTAGGGASPFIGWVCYTAGTPGLWKTFGAISA